MPWMEVEIVIRTAQEHVVSYHEIYPGSDLQTFRMVSGRGSLNVVEIDAVDQDVGGVRHIVTRIDLRVVARVVRPNLSADDGDPRGRRDVEPAGTYAVKGDVACADPCVPPS